MTVLSAHSIRALGIVTPHVARTIAHGMSYGESVAGYDIRIRDKALVEQGHTVLAISMEALQMPKNVSGCVHDKSTWARQGLFVRNTVIEPGWRGFVTLELSYLPLRYGDASISIPAGAPIAQVVFLFTNLWTKGYEGKYQDAGPFPQPAILDGS